MKTIIIWAWAFGFAIAKLLGENNPNLEIDLYDKNTETLNSLKDTRKHPYFFEWYYLPKNISIVYNLEKLKEKDLVLLVLPTQFIRSFLSEIKDKLKSWVIILNLSKWIDNKLFKPVSEVAEEVLKWKKYNYTVLSGGMIALEVVEKKPLWADIWISDEQIWERLKILFQNDYLKINLSKKVKNIELYGSIKNILAIVVWYYEWAWYSYSSIGFEMVEFWKEMRWLIELMWWEYHIDFGDYSLGWDIIATCFGDSRNRYLGKLLWSGTSIEEALNKLKYEKKHAEWYETIKWVYELVKYRDGFPMIKKFYEMMNG